jgi:hypothetical protein
MAEVFLLAKGDRSLTKLVGFLSSLAKGKAWKVEISEYRRTRSNDQNAYLFGVVYPTILKHLPGWDSADVHDYFLGEHFGWETLEGLGRKRLRPIRRSSKLTTVEFSDFVGFIQRTMAERGVYVPDPGEMNELAQAS